MRPRDPREAADSPGKLSPARSIHRTGDRLARWPAQRLELRCRWGNRRRSGSAVVPRCTLLVSVAIMLGHLARVFQKEIKETTAAQVLFA
jgi:hypothetical protein